jgi:ferredoxin-NADP reductase
MNPPRLDWQQATVTAIVDHTPTVKSFFLVSDAPLPHMAGQHVDLRLTAPDGYRAERSYSIGSAPGSDAVELVIERLGEGEVSPFFHDIVAVGDTIELRGPIGGHFNWSPEDGGPVLLVGGGSGIVPLMSILRHRATAGGGIRFVLVYSARHWHDVIFRDELMRYADELDGFSLLLTLTRDAAPPPGIHSGRIDRALIAEALSGFEGTLPRHTFVCGGTPFVGAASMLLVEMGVPFESIRTERYGGAEADLSAEPADDPEI